MRNVERNWQLTMLLALLPDQLGDPNTRASGGLSRVVCAYTLSCSSCIGEKSSTDRHHRQVIRRRKPAALNRLAQMLKLLLARQSIG